MKNNFLVSTTNNIEGCPILNYIDVVCANIVIGTNIFSDFAASFTDFFGGRSDSYKRKLEIIYNEAYKELKQKALSVGANAIVGFKVDFDEISGKDKSMFMISASGTACIIDAKEDCTLVKENNNGLISQEDLDKEIDRRNIVSKINNGADFQNQWIEFLLENPQIEIIDNLLNRYSECYNNQEFHRSDIIAIERLISSFPKKDVIPYVYNRLQDTNEAIRNLIKKCNLFDAKSILNLCEINIQTAINLLSAKSDYYDREDLDFMIEIFEKLSSLPNTGKIEIVKGGLLGKEQEKFICQNGHKSSPNAEFCENPNCTLNIKGLTPIKVELINLLKEKIDIIRNMIEKQ